MQKFKQQHGFQILKLYGEATSTNTVAIKVLFLELKAKIKKYALKNIYNMNEIGLFYYLSLDKIIFAL